jgi:hypothetical protein
MMEENRPAIILGMDVIGRLAGTRLSAFLNELFNRKEVKYKVSQLVVSDLNQISY